MAYFIHNKYSSTSSAKVTKQSDGSYTYNDDNSVIVIDYYGLLENGDITYKLVDTSSIGQSTVDVLTYSDINISNSIPIYSRDSEFNFAKSIVLSTIQRGTTTITTALAAGAELEITINNVDISKTILLHNKSIKTTNYSYSYYTKLLCVYLKNENTIGIKNIGGQALNINYPITIEYQVIEFM